MTFQYWQKKFGKLTHFGVLYVAGSPKAKNIRHKPYITR
jgi:hypothetical protein